MSKKNKSRTTLKRTKRPQLAGSIRFFTKLLEDAKKDPQVAIQWIGRRLAELKKEMDRRLGEDKVDAVQKVPQRKPLIVEVPTALQRVLAQVQAEKTTQEPRLHSNATYPRVLTCGTLSPLREGMTLVCALPVGHAGDHEDAYHYHWGKR